MLVVSHSSRYSCKKIQLYFLNLSSYVQLTVCPFSPDTDPKTAFFNEVTITSSLRSVVQVLIGHLTMFSHTRIVRMIRGKNYEKSSKFVKVTATILSVLRVENRQQWLLRVPAWLRARGVNQRRGSGDGSPPAGSRAEPLVRVWG